MDQPATPEGPLRCSFCNKTEHDVRKLIAGPTVFICDECIQVCGDILADDARDEAAARDAAARGGDAGPDDLQLKDGTLKDVLAALLRELVLGARADAAWVLNPQDGGLFKSLDELSAAAASKPAADGGPSIAAHVDHLRYGLELLNRWSRGEDPFTDADYSASWRRLTVTDAEWARLRSELRAEALAWLAVVGKPRDVSWIELTGMVSSIVHLAYHLGAIRQVDRSIGGPLARD